MSADDQATKFIQIAVSTVLVAGEPVDSIVAVDTLGHAWQYVIDGSKWAWHQLAPHPHGRP